MSFKHVALALDHGPQDTKLKIVLIALCDRANVHGQTWPSRQDMKDRTGLSDATLTRAYGKLEREGWIARKKRFNASTLFRVNFSRLELMEEERNREKVRMIPQGFDPFPEEQVIEKKGNAHSEQTDAHTEHTDAQADHLNLPKNQSFNRVTAKSFYCADCKTLHFRDQVPRGCAVPAEWARKGKNHETHFSAGTERL